MKGIPPIPKSHPFTRPLEQVERILALSPEHPTWRSNKLYESLALEGIKISSPNIQNILNKYKIGTRRDMAILTARRFFDRMTNDHSCLYDSIPSY